MTNIDSACSKSTVQTPAAHAWHRARSCAAFSSSSRAEHGLLHQRIRDDLLLREQALGV